MSEFPLGKRPYTFQRKRFATTSFDEHTFVIAAGNLAKALDRAPKFLRSILPKKTVRVLQLLRNIYEHWEDMRAAFRKGGPAKTEAALKLAKEFPEAEPWTIAIHPDGNIDLANVVFLRSLNLDLRKLEARFIGGSGNSQGRGAIKQANYGSHFQRRDLRKGEARVRPTPGIKRMADASAYAHQRSAA